MSNKSAFTDKPRYSKGKNPNSLANLRPFQAGAPSANPKGRPCKDYSITSLAKEMLDQPADERFLSPSDYGKTWRQAIAKALLVGALNLNTGIMKELLDRLEGKPAQPIVGGEEGLPILVREIEKRKDYGNAS